MPDVGGELVKTVEAQGVDVDVIIMDDDATTMARIRKDMNHNISKWSDINHTSKHFGNSLYSLQKKHKSLTTPIIKWFQKCFKYAIAQNKGNVEKCLVHYNKLYLMLLETMKSVQHGVVTSEILTHTNTAVFHMEKTSVGKRFNRILRRYSVYLQIMQKILPLVVPG